MYSIPGDLFSAESDVSTSGSVTVGGDGGVAVGTSEGVHVLILLVAVGRREEGSSVTVGGKNTNFNAFSLNKNVNILCAFVNIELKAS